LSAGTQSIQGGRPFRDMEWLTLDRGRVYASALTIIWVGRLTRRILSLRGGYDLHGSMFGSDYASFWTASQQILKGHAADVYAPALHRAAELPLLHNGYEAFFYPPPYLLLCIPLATLPFFPSLILFLCATGGALLATTWWILRTPWALIATVAFPIVSLNITPGQNAFLTAAILGSGLNLMDRRPKLAGVVLGLMVIKPHLALAVPIALMLSRRWTTLAYAIACAVGLLALSYVLFGWEVWSAFMENSQESRDTLEQGLVGFAKMESTFAVARWLGAGVTAAYAFQGLAVIASAGGLILARIRHAPAEMERSLIVLACLLMTPFSLFYDMVIVVLPLAWMLRYWLDHGFPPWSKPLMLLVFFFPAGFVFWGPMPFGLPMLWLLGGYLLWVNSTGERKPLAVAGWLEQSTAKAPEQTFSGAMG
jgi:hypothetical protein